MGRLVSFSVGVVNGGLFVNVIPTECTAQVLCVASSPENLAYVYDFMAGLRSPIDGVELEVTKGAERPLFQASPGTLQLRSPKEAAAEIGVALEHGQFGGGSDGNFTGALGIPTLDGLGVVGGSAHTLDEHLVISALAPRARSSRVCSLGCGDLLSSSSTKLQLNRHIFPLPPDDRGGIRRCVEVVAHGVRLR